MTDRELAIHDRPYIDSILATIVWFDLFEYPLTAWEVWKWRMDVGRGRIDAFHEDGSTWAAPTETSYIDILKILHKLVKQRRLALKWSFFFLPGREEIVETRRLRYMLAREKFEKARRVAKWFRFVPFVRLVAVCNTLGYSNAAEDSDIDLFIVTASGKIWTVRGLCLMFLKLFHLRPLLRRFGASREERRDKIDLSFFVTEDALDLSPLALPREDTRHKIQDTNKFKFPISNCQNQSLISNNHFPTDPYLNYWLTQLTPLWDAERSDSPVERGETRGGVYQKLWEANVSLRAHLPHAAPYSTNSVYIVKSVWITKLIQVFFEFVFSSPWTEDRLKRYQMKKLPTRFREIVGGSEQACLFTTTGVVVSDTVLKFHDIDRREEYRERWTHKLEALNTKS